MRRPRIHGRGHLTAPAVILPVASRIVAGWLPPGIRLGWQHVAPPGAHPVVIIFGHQQGVHLNLVPWLRLSYRELVVMVPYTRVGGGEGEYLGPFMCPVALHLDRWLPILLGRQLLAAPKAAARFEAGADRSRIYRPDGRQLAALIFEAVEPAPSPEEVARLVDIFQQPNVCARPGGRHLFFGADWRLDKVRRAEGAPTTGRAGGAQGTFIQALDARLTASRRLVGISDWQVADLRLRGLGNPSVGAAFHLDTRWLLGLPEKRSPALSRWRDARAGLER